MTIYSDTFEPISLWPDGEAVNRVRYADPNSYGPGSSPVTFVRIGGTGHDAFFNSPDLTIASQPMSAVSAEVCLTVHKRPEVAEPNVIADVLVGVQDIDRNFVLAKGLPEQVDPEMPSAVKVPPETTTPCVTLTFDKPVKLVNHPHLVTALDLHLRGLEQGDSWAEVDGVRLQPSKSGDVVPVPQPTVPGISKILPQQ